MKKLLIAICAILTIVSCTSFQKAYFETNIEYSVINGKDTINIIHTDTIPSFADNSFTAYLSGDSSCVIVNSIQTDGSATELYRYENRRFSYPNCKLIIKEFKYKKIREFNASRWDGKEIE